MHAFGMRVRRLHAKQACRTVEAPVRGVQKKTAVPEDGRA
jgi:hypothetical protein